MADLTDSTLEVIVGEEKFIFRLPSPRDYAKMGSRAAVMRRQDAPEGGGSEWGLDSLSQDLYQSMAMFDTLLISADTKTNWHVSKNEKGIPVIDSSKFPPQVIMTMVEVYRGFTANLDTFLHGENGSQQQQSQENSPPVPTAESSS